MAEQHYPHPALLPVLLALSHSGENIDKALEDFIKLAQSTREAMQSMRSSIEIINASMMKITPQGGIPARPWFAGPPPFTPPGAPHVLPAKDNSTVPPAVDSESEKIKPEENQAEYKKE
ncbi:MAG: hypothetical protein ACOY4I_07100 [Bacillota bacterium]